MEVITRLVGDRPIVIFSRSSCDMCHTIKALISGYGANPTVYELDQMAEGAAVERALVQQLGCRPSVPAVFIGQQFVGGDKQVMSLQLKNRLAPMLMGAGAIWVWNGH
ncbi:Monothiol glutaredoxin-S1 [Linum grandiflorum]